MKTLIVSALIVLGSLSAQAANRSENTGIASLVKQLGTVMNNQPNVTQLKKGTTARQLIEEKYMVETKTDSIDPEDFQYEENATSIQSADGSAIGTATYEAALSLTSDMAAEYTQDKDGNALDRAAAAKMDAQITQVMAKLKAAGAVFGFNEFGSGVCGVSYATLYVIDVKNKVIYEFVWVSGPC